MARSKRGVATYGKGYIAVVTGIDRRIIFLSSSDFHRYKSGAPPKGYRPNLGQRRYTRAELKKHLIVLRGGKAR